MGSLSRHSCIGGAALLLAAALACGQQAPVAGQPGGITDRQGVRRDTSSTKYALPSVKIKGLGVKSQGPRAIGRKGGVLLPPPAAPAPRGPSQADVDAVRGAAGRSTERDGVTPRVPSAPGGQSGAFDREVLASGDNVAIARMLRPAIDYSYLSRRAQVGRMMQSAPCIPDPCFGCSFAGYFDTNPDAMTFRVSDTSMTDTYPLDANGKDAFVSGAAAPPGSGPAGVPAMVDPEIGLTDFEKAGNRLYDGKPEQAIVLLRGYVDSHPDEPDAARGLALALIDARRTKEGVQLMADVYARHPALAADPLPGDAVGPEYEMRDLVVRTVEHAHAAKTASAWLTVAVLMQAEGRDEQALRMLDRADSAGLPAEVSGPMRSALVR